MKTTIIRTSVIPVSTNNYCHRQLKESHQLGGYLKVYKI